MQKYNLFDKESKGMFLGFIETDYSKEELQNLISAIPENTKIISEQLLNIQKVLNEKECKVVLLDDIYKATGKLPPHLYKNNSLNVYC
ncbi:MAG: hypothetical protein VZS44_10210 [Bacilli bacterium]|nr:hypothetical protein [Bacilli bacterium]